MADEIKEAGNGAPGGGDLRKDAESHTQESASRGDQREPDWKRMYLEEGKPAQEQANQLRRENAELKNRLAELREDPEPSPAARGTDQSEDYWAAIQRDADAGYGYAKAMLENRKMAGDVVTSAAVAFRVADIEDKATRDQVKAALAKGLDFNTALLSVMNEQKDKENQALREQLAEAQRQIPKSGVVKTEMRDVPVSELAKAGEISGTDYDRRLAELYASDDFAGARELQRARREGKLRIRE